MQDHLALVYTVVPYIGTWIETRLGELEQKLDNVVPYIGTWIETYFPFRAPRYGMSYLI